MNRAVDTERTYCKTDLTFAPYGRRFQQINAYICGKDVAGGTLGGVLSCRPITNRSVHLIRQPPVKRKFTGNEKV